jgi:hypothetical protein
MANLTITVNDQVLKKARMRALEQGTSVNALLREYLSRFAGTASSHKEAVEGLLRLAKTARARRGRRTWTRDELHERCGTRLSRYTAPVRRSVAISSSR